MKNSLYIFATFVCYIATFNLTLVLGESQREKILLQETNFSLSKISVKKQIIINWSEKVSTFKQTMRLVERKEF